MALQYEEYLAAPKGIQLLWSTYGYFCTFPSAILHSATPDII